IGRAFGRARPATGFSADLRSALQLLPEPAGEVKGAVFAPWRQDAALLELVAQLRGEGRRVLWELPGQTGDAAAMGCDQVIRRRDDTWVVERI
ncbi:MAG: ATP phosphoribosyltransferase regulatory subunit, partial [Pseudomonadota bacterium]